MLGNRLDNYWLIAAGWIIVVVGQIIIYNVMMAYVERKAFEKCKKEMDPD